MVANAVAVAEAPSESVAFTETATLVGPSNGAALNVGVAPDVSNEPLPSRSHVKVRGLPSGSEADAVSGAMPPSGTVRGARVTTGGSLWTATVLLALNS